MYRFVVNVDIAAVTLKEAYRKLLARMSGNDWESTDEVYDPNGDVIPAEEFTEACMVVLNDREIGK